MTTQLFISLCLFAFVTSATPGPNNAMLFASGVNFGLRRTVPHLLGVTLGFTFMQLALGLGVGMVFEAVPGLYSVLRVLGLAYMLYLAWAIGTAVPPVVSNNADDRPSGAVTGTPMTFLQATAFQWVNPKALMMCITAASAYPRFVNGSAFHAGDAVRNGDHHARSEKAHRSANLFCQVLK